MLQLGGGGTWSTPSFALVVILLGYFGLLVARVKNRQQLGYCTWADISAGFPVDYRVKSASCNSGKLLLCHAHFDSLPPGVLA